MKIGSLFKHITALVFAISLTMAAEVFAAPTSINNEDEFPYDIELDIEECDRLCYAGHSKVGVKYEDGLAVTPYTQFRVVDKMSSSDYDIKNLDIEIYVAYENDNNTGTLKEVVKRYAGKDIELEDDSFYEIFSENLRNNLNERGRLYSNSLRSLVVKLTYNGRNKKSVKRYFNVCSDDDYYDLLNSTDACGEESNSEEFLEL